MGYNPNQPRNPAGSPTGGEFAGKGSGGGSKPKNVSALLPRATPPVQGGSILPHPDAPGGKNNPHVINEPKNLDYSEDYENRLKALTLPMESAERRAVRDFTGYDYKEFRRRDAAGGNDSTTKNFYAGMEKLPLYNGTVYRGMAALSPEKVQDLLSREDFTLDAMSSFTRSPAIGIDFASTFTDKAQGIVLKMQNKTGRNAEHVSQIPTEFEVMAGKGTTYRINRAYYERLSSKTKPHLVVEGEEI